MDTSIFRYVLEVEKYRNITQAAKRLFISQPALTKQLNKLEKELGFSPFDRTHSPISVTPQGEIFLDFARRYVQLESEMMDSLRQSDSSRACTDCHNASWWRLRCCSGSTFHDDTSRDTSQLPESQLSAVRRRAGKRIHRLSHLY